MTDRKPKREANAKMYATLMGLLYTAPYTEMELASKSGLDLKAVQATLEAMRTNDPKVAYIASWVERGKDMSKPRWRFGGRKDAETKPWRKPSGGTVGPTSIYNYVKYV